MCRVAKQASDLADTSIWIDHFRTDNPTMRQLLGTRSIVMHPFVVAELALGPLRDRKRSLLFLDALPRVPTAAISEVRHMVETRELHNQGIGLVDAHLVATTRIHPPTLLWTADIRLKRVSEKAGTLAELP